MTDTLKHRDGTTSTTVVAPEGNQIRIGPAGAGKGGDIYTKESIAANGDITWRWNRFERPAK